MIDELGRTMDRQPAVGASRSSCLVVLAATTGLTALVALAGRQVIPWGKMLPDYITYWTAGTLVLHGHSPYDVDRQIAIQHALGWERATIGRGVLDFLPYYYPPWFAAACALFVPLGFEDGKLGWFFLNVELLFLTAFLLQDAVPGVPRSIALGAVPLFAFCVFTVLLGQTTILIMFFAIVTLRLTDIGWDRTAGVTLAFLTTKPQLAAVVVLGMCLWASRRQRWGLVGGFAAALGFLCLASSLFLPFWPIEMLGAARKTPPPTDYFPWIGNTWFLILKTLRLPTWSLWPLYLAVAVPFVGAAIRMALDVERPARDVMATGLLAAFFVIPYARHYDFPVLLVPALLLIGGRLSEKAGAALLTALIVLPYLQFLLLIRYSRLVVPGVDFHIECTYFWIPALLSILWFATWRGGSWKHQEHRGHEGLA
jgi:hypothetical protein